MRAKSALSSPQSSPPCMTLTDELRDKAQTLSESSNAMYDTVSSLAGMLYFIDRILAEAPDMNTEFRNSLHQAVQGCKMLATEAIAKDGLEAIMFLRDIATGRVASTKQ